MLRIGLLIFSALLATTSFAAEPLRVASYNIRFANPKDGPDYWPNRADSVAEYLQQFDVIGLQEVTKPQFDQLRAKLVDFESYGLGRDDGKSGGEHAAVFYRRDRLKAIDKGTIWLSPTPDQVGVKGWDAALPRTCTWMVLALVDGEKSEQPTIWIANTHFDHRGAKARTESAKLLRRFTQTRRQGRPLVLMGDFNCRPGSEPFEALTNPKVADTPPLKDARTNSEKTLKGPSSTWNGFRDIVPEQIIDHLFVDGPVKVREFQIGDPRTDEGRFASDHLPVTATIELE